MILAIHGKALAVRVNAAQCADSVSGTGSVQGNILDHAVFNALITDDVSHSAGHGGLLRHLNGLLTVKDGICFVIAAGGVGAFHNISVVRVGLEGVGHLSTSVYKQNRNLFNACNRRGQRTKCRRARRGQAIKLNSLELFPRDQFRVGDSPILSIEDDLGIIIDRLVINSGRGSSATPVVDGSCREKRIIIVV